MAQGGLIWKNLLRYECPACDCVLEKIGEKHYCTSRTCGFWLWDSRLNYLVRGMQQKKPRQWDDPDRNLSDLNNLGRPKLPDDFSESI